MDFKELMTKKRSPAFFVSLLPLAFLIGLLYWAVIVGGIDPHPAVVAAAVLAALISFALYGTTWGEIEGAVLELAYPATHIILFFLMAMLMNSLWLRSGILPSLVYYGARLFPAAGFLYIALIIFSGVGFATGSPWISVGLLGPAFMTMAALLGQSQHMTAGIIVAAAFFGGRLSPLALTNYLAASVSRARLLDHYRHSLSTALPALLGTLTAIFLFEPLMRTSAPGSSEFLDSLPRLFSLSPFLLLVPILMIVLLALRMSALPVLLLGILTGSGLLIFYQGEPASVLWSVIKSGTPALTPSPYWDFLERGGLAHQWWTVALIFCVIIFGGVMKASGMLDALVKGLEQQIRGKRSLGALTVAGGILTNLASPDPYLAVALPGRVFQPRLEETGTSPKLFSRTLADTGPPTAALIPWNMSAIIMGAILGVEIWRYLPWAVFNWLSPLFALVFSVLGIFSINGQGKPSRAKKSDLESFSLEAEKE